MAKKSSPARKSRGAAAIDTIEDNFDQETADTHDSHHESNGDDAKPVETATKAKRTAKVKADAPSEGNVGIGDIKKAAAFANAVGGLDKAIALLQILKVAKEVQ